LQRQIEELLDTGRTPLRAEPDLDAIGEWCIQAHRRQWGWGLSGEAGRARASGGLGS
jgi:hypothetical protein